MGYRLVRLVLVLGGIAALSGVGFAASVNQKPSGAEQGPKLLRLNIGGTAPIAGEAGSFERVLVMPPSGESMTAGNAWEMNADLAIRLSRLPREVRWQAIRRNLGLAPDDTGDLILWSEVADAAFGCIAKLPLEKEPGAEEFGLRVAFPGKETPESPPDVALTFTNIETERNPKKQINVESGLKQGIADAMTGIEGFVEFAADGGTPPPFEALDQIQVQLFDCNKQPVAVSQVCQGYFSFSNLAVDPDFGSDYYLKAVVKDDGVAGGPTASTPEFVYAPVIPGIRTRVHFTIPRPEMPFQPGGEKGINTQNWAISGGPAAMLLQNFVGGNSILDAVTQRLTANPGLHVGVVQVPGSGPTTLWSSRFLIKPPVIDRRPQFVARGKMRLQGLTVRTAQGAASYHYVKITWLGHAEATELKLSSRHVKETPWGIGVGVAPSADPALYAVGASYKLLPQAELLAGLGIQEGKPNSFIYGLTLDVERVLSGVFGKNKEQN